MMSTIRRACGNSSRLRSSFCQYEGLADLRAPREPLPDYVTFFRRSVRGISATSGGGCGAAWRRSAARRCPEEARPGEIWAG
jgi:hypothetical protein